MTTDTLNSEAVGVEASDGVVFGWAIISKVDGVRYFDLHGDHIPEQSMLKATSEFMQGKRIACDMHGKEIGRIVFAWPMTSDIAKAMGFVCRQTGFMVGMKVDDPAVLEKYRNGTYTGFSIRASP